LLLATRDLCWKRASPVCQPDASQSFSGPPGRSRYPNSRQNQRECDILLGIEHVQQVECLENDADVLTTEGSSVVFLHAPDICPIHKNGSERGRIEAGNQLQECTFPAPRRTGHSHEFSVRNSKVHLAERSHLRCTCAVAFGDAMSSNGELC
jgi:hypothetical protein